MIVLAHVVIVMSRIKDTWRIPELNSEKSVTNFDIQSLRPIKRRYFEARETVRDWPAIFALDSYHLPPLKVKGQLVQGQQLTNQTKEQHSEKHRSILRLHFLQ